MNENIDLKNKALKRIRLYRSLRWIAGIIFFSLLPVPVFLGLEKAALVPVFSILAAVQIFKASQKIERLQDALYTQNIDELKEILEKLQAS